MTAVRCGPRLRATGPLASPSRKKIYARPGCPSDCAHAFMRSQNVRLPTCGAGSAQMRELESEANISANTLKLEPRKCTETSCIFRGFRKSGLSVPYKRMASEYEIFSNGVGLTARLPPNS